MTRPEPPIDIRPILPEDVPAIAALARVIWQDAYPGIVPQAQIDYMLAERYNPARLLADLADPQKWLFQAFVDETRAGFACGEIYQGEFKIDKLYVHPAFQRRGVGGALIRWMCDIARKRGDSVVILAVNKQNEKAIRAYQKYGFSVREATKVDIGQGFFMDDYIMEKCGLPKKLRFSKMHGLGNDFMVIDGVRQTVRLTPGIIRRLADRHFGVGFDQLLLVEAASRPDADFRYRIFNADGGEVEQCGNGARCFARFVCEQGLSAKREIRVETQKGILILRLEANGEVTVDMGAPRFMPTEIPFLGAASGKEAALTHPLRIGNQEMEISVVSMGNPHAVLIVEDADAAPVAELGPQIETHAHFPERVNAGFMQVRDRHAIRLRVFERGAGETLACGTGACAAAVTGIRRGLLDSPVRVSMRGGTLTIVWEPGASVYMTGPAVTVFTGETENE